MNFSLLNLFYFAFRIGPFLLISFFILTSFFQQDIKCIVYIVGLLVACFLAILTGNGFSLFDLPDPTKSSASHCHVVTLGDAGPLSKLPLSTVVYAYTAMYLAYPLHPAKTLSAFVGLDVSGNKGSTSRSENTDLPLYFLFPLLILVDSLWLVQYDCFNGYSVVVAALLGVMTGYAWSYIVGSSGKSPFHYFGILGGGQVCERPSGTTFRCEARNPDDLALAEIMALYGIDSPEYRKYMKDHMKELYADQPGKRKLAWKSKDGTVFDLYDGDTIKCSNTGQYTWNRLEISGNDVNNPDNDFLLRFYPDKPDDAIAKSWDPNYLAKSKSVGDCSSFHYGPDMEMNTGDSSSCKEQGIGCSASNMPQEGTEITCLNQMNTNISVNAEDPNYNSMQFMTYRVVDGKLSLIPNDAIRNSWKNAKDNPMPRQLQIETCKMPLGPELTAYNGANAAVPNPVKFPAPATMTITRIKDGETEKTTHSYNTGDLVPVDATVQCTNGGGGKGAANQAGGIVSANSPQDAKTAVPIMYKAMNDGSLSMYPKNDPNVALSYNVDYMLTPVVIPDCSQYTFNGTLGFNPTHENSTTQSLKSFINNTATYLQIYNLTGMNDISGSMIMLQKDLKLLMLGYLETGVWNQDDQNKVSNDVRDVVSDLNGKNSGYSKALATSIREQTSKFGKDLPCKQWPEEKHPPKSQMLQVRGSNPPRCLTTDKSDWLFAWPCGKPSEDGSNYQRWTYDKMSFVLTNDDTKKSVGVVGPDHWGNGNTNGDIGMTSQGNYTWLDTDNVLYMDSTAGSTSHNNAIDLWWGGGDENRKWRGTWTFYIPKGNDTNCTWITK